MFRSFTAFLLICTIISANFSRYFVYAGFELNKDYIAAKLCENRDKPVMQCNGKCYLSKKLKQDAEKEKKQERETKKAPLHEAFFTEKIALSIPPILIKQTKPAELPFALPMHTAAIFHPPKA